MLEVLAQSFNSYDTTMTTQDSAGFAGLAIFSGFFLIIWVALVVINIVALWKIFEKAGVPGWKSIVPIYNTWTLAEIAGKPGWWSLVLLLAWIPVVGAIASMVVYLIIALELAKRFGKDTVFAIVGLVIFSMVGLLILAFGDAKYQAETPPVAPTATPVV